jgi:uncharacterized protein
VSDVNQLNGRGAFYRVARMLHGYVSAAAFLALLFFAATGVLLNHPEWMPAREAADLQHFSLDADALARVSAAGEGERAGVLAEAVASRADIVGAFASGEVIDREALLRFESVRGASTAIVDLSTGAVELEVQRADALAVLNDLHRGKNAGAAWKLLIDVVGALTIALSLLGFVIFFSLRFRLITSMALVAAGAAAMVGVWFLFVS